MMISQPSLLIRSRVTLAASSGRPFESRSTSSSLRPLMPPASLIGVEGELHAGAARRAEDGDAARQDGRHADLDHLGLRARDVREAGDGRAGDGPADELCGGRCPLVLGHIMSSLVSMWMPRLGRNLGLIVDDHRCDRIWQVLCARSQRLSSLRIGVGIGRTRKASRSVAPTKSCTPRGCADDLGHRQHAVGLVATCEERRPARPRARAARHRPALRRERIVAAGHDERRRQPASEGALRGEARQSARVVGVGRVMVEEVAHRRGR